MKTRHPVRDWYRVIRPSSEFADSALLAQTDRFIGPYSRFLARMVPKISLGKESP